MDLNELKSQIQNLTLNDVKKGFRSVQNVVMNLTEVESKVREATTNDPWCASSTLMREIADSTYYTEDRLQIMNMIDRRFHEKGPQEWRQIYKALQLLDYLIRNGDQEVVNSALDIHRVRMLKVMNKSFHALDEEGKDVGQNVRILSGKLHALLQDTTAIREARKEAARNRHKFVAISSDTYNRFSHNGGVGSSSSSNTGFGSSALRAQIRGDGGFYGNRPGGSTPTMSSNVDDYDEADAVPPTTTPSRTNRTTPTSTRTAAAIASRRAAAAKSTAAPKPAAPKPAEPAIDLLDLDFDASVASAAPAAPLAAPTGAAAPAVDFGNDDDFDDFQSAPTAPPAANLGSIAATTVLQPRPMMAGSSLSAVPSLAPSHSGLSNSSAPAGAFSSKPLGSTSLNFVSKQTTAASASKPKGGDAFSDLLSDAGFKKNGSTSIASASGPSLAQMNKSKLDEKLWGTSSASQPSAQAPSTNKASDSLIDLF